MNDTHWNDVCTQEGLFNEWYNISKEQRQKKWKEKGYGKKKRRRLEKDITNGPNKYKSISKNYPEKSNPPKTNTDAYS